MSLDVGVGGLGREEMTIGLGFAGQRGIVVTCRLRRAKIANGREIAILSADTTDALGEFGSRPLIADRSKEFC